MNEERIRTEHHDVLFTRNGDDVEVWLEPHGGSSDGVCLGDGVTRDEAVQCAVDALESALTKLQETTGPKVAAKLKAMRAAGDLEDEELRQWLLARVGPDTPVTTALAREIKCSKEGLEFYLAGLYFAPKELGGIGANPATSNLEHKIRAYRVRVNSAFETGDQVLLDDGTIESLTEPTEEADVDCFLRSYGGTA